MMKLEHKKIGKYLMLTNRKVAQLKHSSIFLGLDTQSKVKVLIKVISKSEYDSNDVLMNSFNFQLNTMKVLHEENILKQIELIMTEKNYYLILEEPHGLSFKKIIEKQGTIKEKQIRCYLKKIRSTFAALQKNNIIHGNINSKSVLVDHNQIKLGYPSYVKTIEIMKTNALKNEQFIMGSSSDKQKDYAYLPPELLATGMVSLKHDIWSLGVVIYEALFGCLPWNIVKCQNPLQMASLILNEKINLSNGINLSQQMKHFLIKCLEVDPTKRFGWEDVLQHAVFNKEIQHLEEKNTDQEQVSEQEVAPIRWSMLLKKPQANSSLTQ